jgi:hypothetical protein
MKEEEPNGTFETLMPFECCRNQLMRRIQTIVGRGPKNYAFAKLDYKPIKPN